MPDLQLPPPSAEFVFCRVAVESFIEVVGPKKGEKFLRCIGERLANEERLAEVIRIRSKAEDAAVCKARREALAWYRAMLPTFIAKL
jgi:hypothetical protein